MNWIDFETYNEVPIKHGTYKYTGTCEPMIVTYALGDDAPVLHRDLTLDPRRVLAPDLVQELNNPAAIWCAHGSMFDRNVLREMGYDIPIERWRDTMVKALAHGLVGSLDILCEIFKLPEEQAKKKSGKQLINLFCKPMPANSKLRRATRETHPHEWLDFMDYAARDITAMRILWGKIPSWNYKGNELALWHLDQHINDRGLCVDLDLANAAIAAVDKAQTSLRAIAKEQTHGEVDSTTKRDALLAHILKRYGVELPDMQKDTLERRIEDPDLPQPLRELLATRLMASSSSSSKYKALINGVSPDGRLRGTMQWNGAARTRRNAGRMFQALNLPRPDMPQADIDFGIKALKAGVADLFTDDVMGLARNAIRGAIIAPPGKKLVVSDLRNIEGRFAPWIAGEQWKLKAFADFDAGRGPDLYKVSYAKSFNVPVETVDDEQRQIGKVEELMYQYQGGVGASITGAATYGIDLDKMAEAVLPTLPNDVLAEAENMWRWSIETGRSTFSLQRHVFVACDAIKRVWRRAHPMITALWPALEDAAIKAINCPGENVPLGMLTFRRERAWLRIQLPSGNYLCYPSVQVNEHGKISYMGMNQYSRRWSRIGTYGGKILENICQSGAGDVLKMQMPAMEDAGYLVDLTVYDEAVTEAPDSPRYTHEELSSILAAEQWWTKGLPLAAAGFETKRYYKGK